MRRGFNLIELIVVIVIIIVLIALLLVGIQQMRATAARMTCANNLKQHALAIYNYESAYECFPPGTLPNAALSPEERLSFHVAVVPYVECGSLYRHIAKKEKWDALGTIAAMENHGAKYYHCPAWIGPPDSMRADYLAITNYVGVAGIGFDAATRPSDSPEIGFFGYDRKVKKEDVKDGLENTAMLFETAHEVGPWIRGGPSTVRAVETDATLFGNTHYRTSWTFSKRADGFNIALGDGSVRFTKPDIDIAVLRSLATIAGGEDISSEW